MFHFKTPTLKTLHLSAAAATPLHANAYDPLGGGERNSPGAFGQFHGYGDSRNGETVNFQSEIKRPNEMSKENNGNLGIGKAGGTVSSNVPPSGMRTPKRTNPKNFFRSPIASPRHSTPNASHRANRNSSTGSGVVNPVEINSFTGQNAQQTEKHVST